MTAPTIWDLAEEWVGCDYCGAEPGSPCVVANGRTAGARAAYAHAARTLPTQNIWYAGYEEGVEDGRWRQENGR